MSTPVYILIIGVFVIVALALVFRNQLSKVPIHYAVLFLLGVLAALGVKKAAEKFRDIEDRLP